MRVGLVRRPKPLTRMEKAARLLGETFVGDDGKHYRLVEWTSDHRFRFETLGEALAHNLVIDDRQMRLADLLVEAGWLPPFRVAEILEMIVANQGGPYEVRRQR